MVQGTPREFKAEILYELKWQIHCKHKGDSSHISCGTRELARNLGMKTSSVSKALWSLVNEDKILIRHTTDFNRSFFTFRNSKEINTLNLIKGYKNNIQYLYEIAKESAIECSKQPAFSNVEYKPLDDWRIIGKNIGKKPHINEKGHTQIYAKHTRPTQRTAKINKAGYKKLNIFKTRLRAMMEQSEGISNYSLLGEFDEDTKTQIFQIHESTIKKLDELVRLSTKGLSYLEREIVKDRIACEIPMLFHFKRFDQQLESPRYYGPKAV